MNSGNLLILATLLERKVKPEHFEMREFMRTEFGENGFDPCQVNDEKLSECGTVACAIGHAPLIFPALSDESWSSYSQRVFGFGADSDQWSWAFGPAWSSTDNTPQGAAKRIRWMVEHGVPHNFTAQITGSEPLCYE